MPGYRPQNRVFYWRPHSLFAGVVTFFLVAAHVLAIILISRQPIVCCNIIFLTFAICCLIPDDGGPSFLWGTWLALGYVGLRIESLWGMFYPSAVALVRIWRFDADGVAVNEYFMLILVMFFAYFIGKMLAWKELAAQFKQNKLRYEELSQHVEYLRKENAVAIIRNETAYCKSQKNDVTAYDWLS